MASQALVRNTHLRDFETFKLKKAIIMPNDVSALEATQDVVLRGMEQCPAGS
jgi:hypothetical protein